MRMLAQMNHTVVIQEILGELLSLGILRSSMRSSTNSWTRWNGGAI